MLQKQLEDATFILKTNVAQHKTVAFVNITGKFMKR